MNVRFLQIEPTNLCNLKCTMCSRTDLKRFGNMSLDGLKSIIEQVPDLQAVKLQGLGEPMLAPDLIPMMQLLKSRSIRVYTAMNGTVLPDDLDTFLRCADRIEYSLDTVDPEKYRSIRQGGDLRKTIQNLELLCDARRDHPDTVISINCVLLEYEPENIDGLFQLAKRVGAGNINFNIPQNWSVNGKSDETGHPELDTLASQVDLAAIRYSLEATLHGPVAGYSNCKWARIGCYITCDGFVTPCCQRPNPDEINFGNVFKQNLSGILDSPRYVEFHQGLLMNVPPHECTTCSAYVPEKVKHGYPIPCKS